MNTQTIERPAIGTAAMSAAATGYVAAIKPARGNIHMLGAGGLERVAFDVEIIFPDYVSTIPDQMARDWIDRAQRMQIAPVSAEEVERLRMIADKAAGARRAGAAIQREQQEQARAAFLEEAAPRLPNWAKAVIFAELREDDSDSMSDYWNSRTLRTVILGFSTHTRDLFPELRKAALNLAETADLFDAPEKAEHREKYSMGGGYYLKNGSRHSNGWKISKQRIHNGARDLPTAEWSLAPVASAPPAPTAAPISAGVAIVPHTHDKKGFAMWIVTLAQRVERDEYDRLLTIAKDSGGWYSRQWGASPAGFAFKVQTNAEAFAAGITGAAPQVSLTTPAPGRAASPDLGAKLRTMADGLQAQIDDKFRDRLSNTPKRQREAQGARLDGCRLERVQTVARALAAAYEAGTVPPDLRGITTKAALFDLARANIEKRGYYDGGRETGPALTTPAACAFWALLTPDPERAAADDLRRKVEALQFANIPGYFPTPVPIVARMIEAARLPDRGSVLEPSAGSGAILDALRIATPACELFTFERHARLRAILDAKGYCLNGADFMDSAPFTVDRVLMNPPFENGQDMAHVRRAFDHLGAGGRLVAIMSPGPFFRQDKAAVAFREWFDGLGGEREDIPAGAFKESGTGVATVLVVIDR